MSPTTTSTMNGTETATTTQVFRVYIRSTAEKIWEAITSPEWNQQYGYHCPAEYELRAGGAYRALTTDQMREMGLPEVGVEGEVLEVDPPHRLVQTWRFNFSPEAIAEGFTTVTWEIHPESDGLCRLTVSHDVTDAPLMAHDTRGDGELGEGGGGWPFILSDLKSLLETGSSLEL